MDSINLELSNNIALNLGEESQIRSMQYFFLTASGELHRSGRAAINKDPQKLLNFIKAFREITHTTTVYMEKVAYAFRETILQPPAAVKEEAQPPSPVKMCLSELTDQGYNFENYDLVTDLRSALKAYYLAELRENTNETEEVHQEDALSLSARVSDEELLQGAGVAEYPQGENNAMSLLWTMSRPYNRAVGVLASSYEHIDLSTPGIFPCFVVDSLTFFDHPRGSIKGYSVKTRRQRKMAENALVKAGQKRSEAQKEVRVARHDAMAQRLGMFIHRTRKKGPFNITKLPSSLEGPGRYCEEVAKWLAYRNFDKANQVNVTLQRIRRGPRFGAEARVTCEDVTDQYLIDTTSVQNAALFSSENTMYQEWVFVAGECKGSRASAEPFTAETTIFSR